MKCALDRTRLTNRRDFLAGLSSAAALGLFYSPCAIAEGIGGLIADTQYGRVQGRMLGKVSGFLGVPYAGPTEGEGRFLPPSALTPWHAVRPCFRAGPRAIQPVWSIFTSPVLGEYFTGGRADCLELTEQTDSENCLVLNVLTPGLVGQRPVLVYIHGGGFNGGSSALTTLSDRFVHEEDVVVVGVNHRLNVFGYTYLGDLSEEYADSGNIGQLDLVAAPRWVKSNIANFGGDPTNVTLFGESGGAAKISTLLAMRSAHGLFHRAIIESGYLDSVRSKESATADTKKVMAAAGLSFNQISDFLALPANQLLAAMALNKSIKFGPVCDGRSLLAKPWETGAPHEAAGVDLIIGNCKDESTLFVKDQRLFSLDWSSLRNTLVQEGVSEANLARIIDAYRKDHPADNPTDVYFRLTTDRTVRREVIAQAEMKVTQGDGKIFVYNFAWNTPVMDGKARAFHTAELPLAMRLVASPKAERLSKQIAGAWAAFARKGDPNHPAMPKWEPYSILKRPTIIFDINGTKVEDNPGATEQNLLRPYPAELF